MNMPRRMRRGEGYRDATEPKTIDVDQFLM